MRNVFVQEMIISSNIFLNNKLVHRNIKPDDLFTLAKSIETVWNTSKSNSIPYSKSIDNIRDFKDWYFNSDEVRVKYQNINIDVKKKFGFYSSSAVCLPDFYSNNSMASYFSFFLMIFNLLLITCISFGYVLIFYKIRSKKMSNSSNNTSEKEKSMLFRIFLIVATDIACWLPIILLTFANFYKYEIPEIVYSLTSIVFLPINSLLNPILYSRIEVTLIKGFLSLLKACKKVYNMH